MQSHIPNIEPECDIGAELSYQLPDNYSNVFEQMFSELENQSQALNLNGYGIGITSMEEVFMKVGAENNSKGESKQQKTIMNGGTGFDDVSEQKSKLFLMTNCKCKININYFS